MLWADGLTVEAPGVSQFEGELIFSEGDLAQRYSDLAPSGQLTSGYWLPSSKCWRSEAACCGSRTNGIGAENTR